MKHKEKVKIARKLSGKTTGHFESKAWEERSKQVAERVKETEEKSRKMKILDDKGNEHKVGEIFTSDTVTIEL